MIGDIKHVKKLSYFFTCVLFTCVFSQGWKSLYCNEVYMINSIVLSVQAHVSPYVQSHTLSAYTSPYLCKLTELRFRSESFHLRTQFVPSTLKSNPGVSMIIHYGYRFFFFIKKATPCLVVNINGWYWWLIIRRPGREIKVAFSNKLWRRVDKT